MDEQPLYFVFGMTPNRLDVLTRDDLLGIFDEDIDAGTPDDLQIGNRIPVVYQGSYDLDSLLDQNGVLIIKGKSISPRVARTRIKIAAWDIE